MKDANHPDTDPNTGQQPLKPTFNIKNNVIVQRLGINALNTINANAKDLSTDKLIASVPRISINNKWLPLLGGIPILSLLGKGGMGAVYHGFHIRLEREVAIKILPFHLADENKDMIERFYREARTAARINGPNLVTVYDVNEDIGIYYMVMEYIAGCTSGEYLKKYKKINKMGLSEKIAIEICIAACQGLSLAHNAGIIHRDIKPDNIIIPFDLNNRNKMLYGNSKLSDLGLARTNEQNESLTGTKAFLGTPGYMSPEQVTEAKNVGKPADIFSMGVTLYALLAGETPFRGTSLMQIMKSTCYKKHTPISDIRSDLSSHTLSIIDKCLEKDPLRRYPDADSLLDNLLSCGETFANKSRMKSKFDKNQSDTKTSQSNLDTKQVQISHKWNSISKNFLILTLLIASCVFGFYNMQNNSLKYDARYCQKLWIS